jgi:ribosomal protein L40E
MSRNMNRRTKRQTNEQIHRDSNTFKNRRENTPSSQIIHRFFEFRPSSPTMPHCRRFSHNNTVITYLCSWAPRDTLQECVKITSPSFATQIGVVCRRCQAHRLRSAGEHVAHGVCEPLKSICFESDLVVHNIVVCRSCGALETTMRCVTDKY